MGVEGRERDRGAVCREEEKRGLSGCCVQVRFRGVSLATIGRAALLSRD